MKRNLLFLGIVIVPLLFLRFSYLYGQQNDSITTKKEYKNSIDIGPDGEIYFIHYGRKLTAKDEIVIGSSYFNPSILNMIQYPGTLRSYTLELGCRKYLWRNIHLELQMDPQYVTCKDTVAQESYNGFGLVSEIRFGYRFDLNILKVPFFINIQWFAGYQLINVKPQSFRKVDAKGWGMGESYYISPIPMFLLGIRF